MARDLPRRFGDYVLEEFLAEGGMAEVYIGRHAQDPNGPRVCIKTIRTQLAAGGGFETMFEDEVWLGRRLDHDNVVRMLDAGDHEGTRFMVMELVQGLDLAGAYRALKKKGRMFSVAEAVAVASAMCRGLHYAHQLSDGGQLLQVIHRDVSPQNVLIDASGLVKVTDFGIAKAKGRTTHTQTGIVKGKVSYMAPEQALGGHIDHRVDQFATGTVLWEMLTSKRLFREKSDMLTLEKILKQKTHAPSGYRTEVPSVLDTVVLKALSKRPQDRWPNMQAFETALRRAAARVPGAQDEIGTMHAMMSVALADVAAEADLGEGASLTRGVAVTGRGNTPSAGTQLYGDRSGATGMRTASRPVPARAGTGTVPSALLGTQQSEPDFMDDEPAPARAGPGPGGGGAGNLMVLPLGQSQPAAASTGSTSTTGIGEAIGSASRPVFVERAFDWRIMALVLLVGVGLGAGAGWFARGVGDMCAPPADSPLVRENADQLLDAADLALQSGDVGLAVESLKRSLKMHGSGRGYVLAGKLRARAGKHEGALEAFRCALEVEPMSTASQQIRDRVFAAAKE